jgi:two-component system chemotaxis sensor kinase CheA
MSLEDDDMWKNYAADAVEALRAIEESLLALELEPQQPAEVNQLYRALHTLKGNSAFLQLSNIERLAHVAEDMVGLVRDGGVTFDADMADLMLAAVDRLRVVVDRAAAERRDADVLAVADMIERVLDLVAARTGERPELATGPRVEQTRWEFGASSAPPPAGPGQAPLHLPPDNTVSLEIFLALAREAVNEVEAGPAPPPAEGQDAPPDIRRARDDLHLAAESLGFGAVAGALARLSSEGGRGEGGGAALVSELRAALADIEVHYRTVADVPSQFGFAPGTPIPPAVVTPSFEDLSATMVVGAPPALRDPTAILRAAPAAERPPEVVAAAPPSPVGVADPGGGSPPSPRRPLTTSGSPMSTGSAQAADSLRIDGNKVTLIMDLAGELGQACDAVTHHVDLVALDLPGFASAAHKLEMLVRELQNEVSGLRLVPVASVFKQMTRVARDTARRTGKQVELSFVGEETEIDKVMVDALHDPLVHMIRNAIDHGIESPDERERAGKPRTGRIVLDASHQGGEVSVEISDDGRGLDRPRILEKARSRGLVAPDQKLTDAEIDELVFLPGFSTKEQIDALSGRGVGMDVIKTAIERLRGRVKLRSTPGHGARLSITVPLTLAFVDAMVVTHNGHLFALPIERVLEVFKAGAAQVARSTADGVSLLRVRDRLVPVLWLHQFFGQAAGADTRVEDRIVVVVQTSTGGVALPVDRLLGHQQIMLKPLRGLLGGVRAAAGYGMLRSGDVCLALDCERLHAA